MIREFRIPVPGMKRITVCHAGDFHLNCADELSSDDEKKRAEEAAAEWYMIRRDFAVTAGEPFGEEQELPPEEHFLRALAAARECGDALILTGDVFDSVTPANLRFFDCAADGAGVPVLTVCGNHEDRDSIPPGRSFSPAREPVQVLRLGGLTVAGIDDSRREITAEQLAALEKLLAGEDRIILAMHVPVLTDGMRESGKIPDEYFFLNYGGCPAENLELIRLIRDNAPKFAAVLTGHTHTAMESEIAPGVTQYTVSQGIAGNVNRYVIGE